MEFLGIGPLELIVVLVIALIVVGPERLPQVARSISKALSELRAMSQDFSAELQRELTVAPPKEAGEKGLQQSLTNPLKEAQADLQRALTAPLTSPSEVTGKPAPPETPPTKPNNTLNDDADHVSS